MSRAKKWRRFETGLPTRFELKNLGVNQKKKRACRFWIAYMTWALGIEDGDMSHAKNLEAASPEAIRVWAADTIWFENFGR